MTHQPGFSQVEFADKKKITRREKFLTRMEALISRAKLLAVIEPFYPKGQRGRPPAGLERMLRVYFLRQWYGLADESLSKTRSTTVRSCWIGRLTGRSRANGGRSKLWLKAQRKKPKAVEKAKAAVRAFVEHPFHILKNIFRHRKVRYRGLAKNGHQLYTLFGLANVVIGGRRATT